MTDKTYTRAGISTNKGKTQFRFTNDLQRERVLAKNGHTDIKFFEIGAAVSKAAATAFLLEMGLAEDAPAKPAKAAKEPTRKDDERILAQLDAGELTLTDDDEFVEPKDERIQVAMTRKAREYPGVSAHQLLEMVKMDFRAFPETGEPDF